MVKKYKRTKRKSNTTRRKPRMQRQMRGEYRDSIPRTIQIATKRNLNQVLKFSLNQSWVLDPSNNVAAGRSMVLQYSANSLFKSHIPMIADGESQAYKPQDPTLYSNKLSSAIFQNAEGYDTWRERYQHFCVTGSKLTYTWEPIGQGVPAVLFAHLSGVTPAIIPTTTSAVINKLPFTNRHSIASIGVSSPKSAGIRGNLKYSCRNFEGIKDPIDNSQQRGRFGNQNTGGVGLPPGEQSYFNIAISPVDPATTGTLPAGVLRVKVEYIAHLKEPTESNQIQVQPRGGKANEL